MHLSIIVPAYQEEKKLQENIIKYINYLKNQSYSFELIIVNDGSRDKTAKIAAELEREMSNIKLINNKNNRGKGAAVCQGLLAATGKYRLFIDADNAAPIDHLELVWPQFEAGYDIVIGSRNPRDASGAKLLKSQPPWKKTFGILGNRIFQLFLIKGIYDTQCGFKAFTEKAIKDIILKVTLERWAFDVEILILAQKNNYKIAKIPIRWTNCPDSKVKLKDYFITLKELAKIKKNLFLGKYK